MESNTEAQCTSGKLADKVLSDSFTKDGNLVKFSGRHKIARKKLKLC